MTKRIILLISNGISERKQAYHQNLSLNLLNARRMLYETVDGADPTQTVRRNKLFNISGIRGMYPQWFLANGDDDIIYIGDWPKISEINDNDDIPAELRSSISGLVTWDMLFSEVPKADPVTDDHPMKRMGSYRNMYY